MEKESILELRNLTKTFGDLVAVDSVDFALQAGEIHAILGENGAGKSTLMNLIYGLYQPSAGRIYVTDREGWQRRLRAKSPRDAIAMGIGMVHQHFMLVENLTVAGEYRLKPWASRFRSGGKTPLKKVVIKSGCGNSALRGKTRFRITEELSDQFGLAVDPSALVRTLSVGFKTTRRDSKGNWAVDARILILDEPTAVLSPQEVEGFLHDSPQTSSRRQSDYLH